MIDYDATLQQFFAECIKFLEKQRLRANDQIALKRINDAISVVYFRHTLTNTYK